MTAPPSTRNQLAARFIGKHAPAPEQVMFAEMLGLVADDGFAAPDDMRPIKLDKILGGSTRGGLSPEDKRSVQSTAPDALRNLPPAEALKPVPTPKAPRKDRATNPNRTPVPRKTYVGSPAQIAAAQAAGRSRQAPCGRYGAYRRHLRNGEPVDEACAEAAREQSRARERQRGRRPQQLQPCGTDAGYRRHIRRSTPVCAPCRAAHNERNRQLKAQEAA